MTCSSVRVNAVVDSSDSDEDHEVPGAHDGGGEGGVALSQNRTKNNDWKNASVVMSNRDGVCKKEQQGGISCITQHHDFSDVCLNEAVLGTVHDVYQDRYSETLGPE
ncbi:hypothetical protein Bbelb_272520 [Branchiostoma belcheri]|nr:hypothetical protein Bbelb_272520 [Branchiostoma belcheri]